MRFKIRDWWQDATPQKVPEITFHKGEVDVHYV